MGVSLMKRSLVLFGAAAWAWCASAAFAQVSPLAPSKIVANENYSYSYFEAAGSQVSPSDRSALMAKAPPAEASMIPGQVPQVPLPECAGAAPACGADGGCCDDCGCGI